VVKIAGRLGLACSEVLREQTAESSASDNAGSASYTTGERCSAPYRGAAASIGRGDAVQAISEPLPSARRAANERRRYRCSDCRRDAC
jgi:hypothetical protein